MTEKICPDVPEGSEEFPCWTPLPDPTDPDADMKEFLMANLADGLVHQYGHALTGPGIYGYNEGVPNFEVYRNDEGWHVRSKKAYVVQPIVGIFDE